MTKKLTLEQVNQKIDDLECSYYKGWKMDEYAWRFSGRVSKPDLMYWGKLHKIKKRVRKQMSGFVQDWDCTQCEDGKGFQETFKDTEEGYILECLNCKYMEVYREDVDTGKVVEDYAGYEHYYNNKQARG